MELDQDHFFQALASPYRREILRLLERGEQSAGEIAGHFHISQPAVSRHLDLLKRTGLACSRREGNQILYSLDRSAARQARQWLGELFQEKGLDKSSF